MMLNSTWMTLAVSVVPAETTLTSTRIGSSVPPISWVHHQPTYMQMGGHRNRLPQTLAYPHWN